MFNNDERFIKKRFGKKDPFVVPKGYFDNIAPRVMENIAKADNTTVAKPVVAKVVTLSPWKRYRKAIVGIAAGVCVAMMSLGAYFHADINGKQDKAVAARQSTIQPTTEYSSLDAAVDYSMMDTDDMYAYMADLN